MSNFNDFMIKAGALASKAAGKTVDLASAAAAKTKQVSRIAKLNMDIAARKDALRQSYVELGKLYYETHRDAPEQELAQCCQEIDQAVAAIADMETEIAQLKQTEQDAVDVDFASVVDETASQAGADDDGDGVEVEIVVETEQPAPEAEPVSEAEPAWDAPAPQEEEPVEPAIEE